MNNPYPPSGSTLPQTGVPPMPTIPNGVPPMPTIPNGVPPMPTQSISPYPTQPVTPYGQPMEGGMMPAGANLSTGTLNLEDSIAVVAYIAYQTSYFKKGVIDNAQASVIYRKFYSEQSKLPDGDKNKVPKKKVAIDVKGQPSADGKTCSLEENYSAARFRTFCTEEWKKMIKQEYCEIVMSEAKAEYFVIKAVLPENTQIKEKSRILDGLKKRSTASTTDSSSLFIVKKSNIIAYMSSAGLQSINVYNNIEDLKQHADPDGFVLARQKTSRAKNNTTVNYVIRFVKTDKVLQEYKVVSLAKQVIENYAINRDMTRNQGKICKDESKIVNLAKFRSIFPEVTDPCAIYGEQVNYTRKNPEFAGEDQTKLKEAKAKTIIKFGEGKGELFAKIGLDEKTVQAMRENKQRSTNGLTLQQMLSESRAATTNYYDTILNATNKAADKVK